MTEAEEIKTYRQLHGHPGMTAAEFEKFLPERLKQVYWRMKIEEYFRHEEEK